VIMRERLAGWYGASAYVMAKALTEILFQFNMYPLLFTCIVYFLIGYQRTSTHFFIFLGFMLLCSFTANSVAILVSAVTGKIILAAAALPLAMEVTRLFGAYYMNPTSLPVYFEWLQGISYITYVYSGTMINEFTSLQIGCNATAGTPCLNGDQVLASLGLGYVPLYASLLA
jgi:hypothetical protein